MLLWVGKIIWSVYHHSNTHRWCFQLLMLSVPFLTHYSTVCGLVSIKTRFVILFLSVLDETPIIPFSWHSPPLSLPLLLLSFLLSIHALLFPKLKTGWGGRVLFFHFCHVWFSFFSAFPLSSTSHFLVAFSLSSSSFPFFMLPFSLSPSLYLY